MRVRKKRISVRLTESEHAYLTYLTGACGMKIEPFIRALIMQTEIRPKPPDDWPELIRQVSSIGNNINQIARVANSNRNINAQGIEDIQRMQAEIWKMVKAL